MNKLECSSQLSPETGLELKKYYILVAFLKCNTDIDEPDISHSDIGHSDIGQSDIGHSDIGHSRMGHSRIKYKFYSSIVKRVSWFKSSLLLRIQNKHTYKY